MIILENELMSKHTTFKIGGPCKKFIICNDFSEEVFSEIANSKYKIIGNGSNLLVPDTGYDGVVVKLNKNLMQLSEEKNTITVSADKMLIDVCRFARENSLSGLEWAYGIPGTVGGAVYMNAGAYGGEMKDVLFSVNGYEIKATGEHSAREQASGGQKKQASGGQVTGEQATNFSFGYRYSSFMDNDEIIKTAEIRLKQGNKEEIDSEMKSFMEKRKTKQPLEYPSSGSFFKRPCNDLGKEVYAAKLIEDCGLKGYSVGGAQVSEKHAGFIINKGGATFSDVMHLAEIVRERVLKSTGFNLEIEPEILR
ncbi:MAG: UDP-N-acetylmuramate dehydrogenase [Ruminococcus sp.]|jgi:UDP-N-acetylmuramate dehydrogenase|nr:UDP-N-acetylmuramate dehydrogenase [Ruminococcus sp.]